MTRLVTTLTLVLTLTMVQLGFNSAPAWALYVLAFGDSITIAVKDAPQYSISGAHIRPDGAITLPYVGDIEVVGLTPFQVTERVEKLLAKFLRGPQVSVTVASFRGSRISVFGEVARPGSVSVPAAAISPTIMEAIAQAGGFTNRANRSEVAVLRGTGADAKRYVVNVEHMLRTGDFSENMSIQDRDTIMIYEVWYPDVRDALTTFSTIVGVIGAVTLIVNTYNRASGQ